MTVFLTSDLHLGHVNNWRPFETLDEMHATIQDNWNRVVSEDDVVYILGDAIMGPRADNLPLLDGLNGMKLLTPGNHDYVHPMHGEKMNAKWSGRYGQHVRLTCVEWGSLLGLKTSVRLCHFPRIGDHTEEVRYPEWRPADDGGWLFHGHLHSKSPMSPDRPRQIDVGLDAWNFTPVALDTLVDYIKDDPK